ncbi:MAG: DUF4307 domain-containing protein [Propionibacteriales bacterium]|nr:DUF4307 domain-containing protein [Propionibacteriales bacterium]
MDHPTRPVERYGSPRPWVRLVAIVATGLVALAAAGWLLWAAWSHSRPEVVSQLRGFEVIDKRTVSATITVERQRPVRAICVLKAQATDHTIVGELGVAIPADAPPTVTRTYEIPTERPATAAVLDGCTTDDQSRQR